MNTTTMSVEEKANQIGSVIGCVRINKPYTQHYASYECAAWYEDREIEPGIYELRLERAHHSPKHLQAVAKLVGVVTDDYFAGLWCGVPISREPYKPKHVGEKRDILRAFDLQDCIERTGVIPNGTSGETDFDIFMIPDFWYVALNEAETELRATLDYLHGAAGHGNYGALPRYEASLKKQAALLAEPAPEYAAWNRSGASFDERKRSHDFRTELVGIESAISAVAYCGTMLSQWGSRIENIRRKMQYLRMLPNHETNSWIELHNRNTAWARNHLMLPEMTGPERQG